ncbi:MAG TPA: hypothetical protein DCS23_00430 [Candidatus Yonathbacteria bacterium]|nr:hypothetical protein [Candidatus Yonathbacteria bacterium]
MSFSAANKVTFTSAVDATVFTSWSDTAISTQVPTGAVTGNVVVTSDTNYTSNGVNFTLASAVPNNPTSLDQFKDVGLTQAIAIGGSASSTPIYLKMTMQAALSGGMLYPQVEYKAIGTPFVCTDVAVCASDALEGTGSAGPGPTPGSVSIPPNPSAETGEVYHWQARVKHTKNAVDYYSAWVSFDDVNPETATDFKIDIIAPVISGTSSGTPGTNSASITWSTSGEISTTRIEYDTAGTFTGGYDCAGTSECTALTDTSPMINSPHTVALSNLSSGTTYHYRVRSKDAAGNESIDPSTGDYTFPTATENHPAKTTVAVIFNDPLQVTTATTTYFTVHVPELSPTVQSAYIEVVGLVSGGFSGTITVQANSAASRAYTVSTAASTPTLYRFVYPISSPGTETNLNLNDVAPCSNSVVPGTPPGCNKVVLTPSTGSINVLSAKIITTYSYTP